MGQWKGGEEGFIVLYSQCDALALNDALTVLPVDLRLTLSQLVQGVDLGKDAANEASGPKAIGLLLGAGGALPLANAGDVEDGGGVAGQVASVAQLTADGGVLEESVGGLGVGGGGSGLEVLNVLADAQQFAGEAKLLLDGRPRRDGFGGRVGALEIPGVEAGKILQHAEDLVAAEGGRDEAQVVRD